MSRLAQIRFLSRHAAAYDVVTACMRFGPLWEAIADIAAPAPGEAVLDVCTGTGGVAFALAQRGARVTGVDLADGMLQRARRRPAHGGHPRFSRPHFVRMDARRLAFPDASFSLVTCAMALHEMSEPERAQTLREVRRVAGRRVVVAEYRVPRSRWRGLLFRAGAAYEYLESDDFPGFLRRDVEDRLAEAGLTPAPPHDVGAYRIWPCRLHFPP